MTILRPFFLWFFDECGGMRNWFTQKDALAFTGKLIFYQNVPGNCHCILHFFFAHKCCTVKMTSATFAANPATTQVFASFHLVFSFFFYFFQSVFDKSSQASISLIWVLVRKKSMTVQSMRPLHKESRMMTEKSLIYITPHIFSWSPEAGCAVRGGFTASELQQGRQ